MERFRTVVAVSGSGGPAMSQRKTSTINESAQLLPQGCSCGGPKSTQHCGFWQSS